MKTLVAGFGNLLMGDDGFGVEVVRRLTLEGLPPGAEAMDVGIGVWDLVLALLGGGYGRTVIVDAVRRGGHAGTLHIFTPGAEAVMGSDEAVDPHITEPSRAIGVARRLGAGPMEIVIVGCEPADWDLGIGLSPPVHEAVGSAVSAIRRLVEETA